MSFTSNNLQTTQIQTTRELIYPHGTNSSSLCISRTIKTQRSDDNIDSKQNPCLNRQIHFSSPLYSPSPSTHAHFSLFLSQPFIRWLFTSSCSFLHSLCLSFTPLSFSISIPLPFSLFPQGKDIYNTALIVPPLPLAFFLFAISLGNRSLILSMLC